MKKFMKITTCLLIALALGATVMSCKKDVETVEVTPANLTLKVGQTSQLSATVTPEKAEYTLSWSSNTPAVAAVDGNGKVTAIAEGTAVITVEAGGKTATCTVIVEEVVPAGIVLEEHFEAGILPSGWGTLDADGDSFTWDPTMLYGTSSGHSASDGMIISASYRNDAGALTPDNWLITPQVKLNGKAVLTFWLTAQDAGYAAEHYAVYISKTGTNPSDFTLLFEETFGDSKGGAKGAKEQATWKQKTINLAGYTGNCYIAIRHFDCTDQFYLNLDDLKIENK
jgi:hypothetical protein